MPNWLDRLIKDNKKGGGGGRPSNNKQGPIKNPFAQPRKFAGAGQSLGGSKPGRVFQVTLAEHGSLGCKVERRPEGTAILSMVVPGTQADKAGLQRGDILCFPDSGGQEEITYEQFLQMAKSDLRPLCLDVRRIETKSAAGAASRSAEAYSRKQAVIAAAEAREKKSKAKQKPLAPSTGPTGLRGDPRPTKTYENDFSIKSEEARRAVEAAKKSESKTAAALGYNPYETNKATAGQARNATVAVAHGAISGDSSSSAPATVAPGPVAPPRNPTTSVAATEPVSVQFEDAYTTTVTTNLDPSVVIKSFSIMRKLMTNATTKGLQDEKFRKIRLSNAKIKAAITDVHGALDMMMAVGFQLTAEGDESYLVFPPGSKGPKWLGTALQQMESYEKASS